MDVQIDGLGFSEDGRSSAGMLLSTTENRTVLLSNIDMHLCAGHVVSIFGDDPSASHALVQTVALRQTRGYMEGTLCYDTESRACGLYRDVAYIPDSQECFHFERLRVFESLYFAARLRTSQSIVECRERARDIARFLDLDGSSYVGNLNATETRLLTIASEV
jgi:ABC-type multidrug transport system ATPase subunit